MAQIKNEHRALLDQEYSNRNSHRMYPRRSGLTEAALALPRRSLSEDEVTLSTRAISLIEPFRAHTVPSIKLYLQVSNLNDKAG